jgi:hypothetical protein
MTRARKPTKTTPTRILGGDEYYTPDANEVIDAVYCRTCGDEMGVEPEVEGATGFAEAMAGRSHKHHFYTCPNVEANWHVQVIRLRKEIQETASAALAKIMQKEIKQILKTRKATKVVHRHF